MRGFVGETLIPLLTGVTQQIQNLNNSFSTLTIQVYSLNNCELSISQGTLCLLGKGKTIEILLDNGTLIKCGEDQEFILREGNIKKAKDLATGDSLMPLYKRISDDIRPKDYELVYNPFTNKEVFTHQMVGHLKYLDKYPKKTFVIHHKNFNKLDNHPNNLELMGASEHHKYHIEVGKTFGFKVLWKDPEYRKFMVEVVSKSSKKYWKNMDSETYSKMVEMSRELMNRNWANEEFKERHSKKLSELSKEWWKDDNYRATIIERQRERFIKLWKDEDYRATMINNLTLRSNTPEAKARSAKNFRKSIKKVWLDEAHREKITELSRKRMTREFRLYLQEKKNKKLINSLNARGITFESIKSVILKAHIRSIRGLSLCFGCSVPLIRRVLTNAGIAISDQAEWVRNYKNHQVISIIKSEFDYLFSLNFEQVTKFAISDVFVLN